jgi:hypothetical protein
VLQGRYEPGILSMSRVIVKGPIADRELSRSADGRGHAGRPSGEVSRSLQASHRQTGLCRSPLRASQPASRHTTRRTGVGPAGSAAAAGQAGHAVRAWSVSTALLALLLNNWSAAAFIPRWALFFAIGGDCSGRV